MIRKAAPSSTLGQRVLSATNARAPPLPAPPRLHRCLTTGTSTASSSAGPQATSASNQHAESSTRAPTHADAGIRLPLSFAQRAFLTLGSALAALQNPARGDMIALLSEVSGERLLPKLRDGMLSTREGRTLLATRPQISTATVDMEALRALPDGTFGKEYVKWMEWCRVGPDTRDPVRYVADPELSYVMARYRQSHDFYHLLCLMPVSHLGETVVKVFEASHFGLPVAFLSSVAGPLRLDARERAMLFGTSLDAVSASSSSSSPSSSDALASLVSSVASRVPSGDQSLASWAWEQGKLVRPLLGVHWEARWSQDFEELRAELGFTRPPPHRVAYAGRRTTTTKAGGVGGGRWPSKVVEAEKRLDVTSAATMEPLGSAR